LSIIGSVHKQTVAEGLGCEEFYNVSLSEVSTIKSLILNRHEFDSCFDSKIYYSDHPFVTNGIPLFQEPVEVLYLDLERLIKESNLNKYQRFIIHCLMRTYDYEYIAEYLHWTTDNVEKVFDDACGIIKEQNDYDWITWAEVSGQTKIPDEVKYKRCSKCEKDLRLDENFNKDSSRKDGYKYICKNCESVAKKSR
jgi:hypothetical protein